MTQLPTPVVRSEFGDLVGPLIKGLRAAGANVALQTNVEAREDKKTALEHRVGIARASGAAFDARLEAGRQRVLLDSMKIEYTKAVDEERRGMLAILANADEEERARYLREHPFLSRQNQAYAMALHGQQMAGMDLNGAQAQVLKHFAAGGDSEGIDVSVMMDDALKLRESMPNEALIAYQGHFIPQVRGMIKSQKTRAATKRQASLETRADITVDTQINMVINGEAEWDSVLPEWAKLKGMHALDSQPSDLELYKKVGVQFAQSLPNFAGRYDEATEVYEGMPQAMRDANPQIPRQIKRASDQYEMTKHNREATRWKENFRAVAVDSDANSVALMESMLAAMPENMLNDPHAMTVIRAIIRKARSKNERTLAYMDDRIDYVSADLLASGAARTDFGTDYNGQRSWSALRALKNARGTDAAVNYILGTDNSGAAIAMIYAEDDTTASKLSDAYENRRLREQLDAWGDYVRDTVGEVGDPGDDFILRLEGIQSIPSRAEIEHFRQQIVIRASLKFAANDTQDSEQLIKAEVKTAIGHLWGDTHVEISGKAVRDTWIDASGGASRMHAKPRLWYGKSSMAEAFLSSVTTGAGMVGARSTGATPNYHGMFQWADDNTYTPIVGSNGVAVFNKWDPTGEDRGENITPDHEMWEVILQHYEAVVPETQRVRNGDYRWGDHYPSQYIMTNDSLLFPGGESGGYWERGLKPVIIRMWRDDHDGDDPPGDFPPSVFASPDFVEAWKEDVREYLIFQGDILEGLGWQRATLAPELTTVTITSGDSEP